MLDGQTTRGGTAWHGSSPQARGLSDEEANKAAREAAELIAVESVEMTRLRNAVGSAQSRYYMMAHSVEETIKRQPSLLRPPPGASLREYQMTGVQWMVSLYNNHLNGILADEMGEWLCVPGETPDRRAAHM